MVLQLVSPQMLNLRPSTHLRRTVSTSTATYDPRFHRLFCSHYETTLIGFRPHFLCGCPSGLYIRTGCPLILPELPSTVYTFVNSDFCPLVSYQIYPFPLVKRREECQLFTSVLNVPEVGRSIDPLSVGAWAAGTQESPETAGESA